MFQKVSEQIENIITFDKYLKYFGPFILIGLGLMIGNVVFQKMKTKKEYYQAEFHFRLGKCVDTPNYRFYKIDNKWFAVQGQLNAYICPNDSLSKEKNTHDTKVFHSNGHRRKYHLPYNSFKNIESDHKLKRYFKLKVDTLAATFECVE